MLFGVGWLLGSPWLVSRLHPWGLEFMADMNSAAEKGASMKRDMDLVRKLLFAIETHEFSSRLENPPVEGYDEATIDHHVFLMKEAGLVEALSIDTQQSGPHRRAAARRLTWKGHDALDVLRSDTVWAKTKGIVAKAGGASIQMVIDVASSVVKEQLGLK